MPQFSYTGLQAGKKVVGAIVANDRIDAGKKLKNQKIIPTNLNQIKDNNNEADPEIKTFLGMQLSSDKLSSVDIMLFYKKTRNNDQSRSTDNGGIEIGQKTGN